MLNQLRSECCILIILFSSYSVSQFIIFLCDIVLYGYLSKWRMLSVLRLIYDPVAKEMVNTPGVFTRCPDFGNTTAIEWLDPNVHGPGIYFYPLVASLANVGYKRGHNLRAAPYDFRFHPSKN